MSIFVSGLHEQQFLELVAMLPHGVEIQEKYLLVREKYEPGKQILYCIYFALQAAAVGGTLGLFTGMSILSGDY